MSRSRRKTPVHGITVAESDKWFKMTERRRARRAAAAALRRDEEPPAAKEFGNPWRSAKDGKSRFDPAEYPGLMRK